MIAGLLEAQQQLDAAYQEQFQLEGDQLDELFLALLVEIGECANEWRMFKFWSKNRQPIAKKLRYPAMMEEDKVFYNPMLEEFVDGLKFILSIANRVEFDVKDVFLPEEEYWQQGEYRDVLEQFSLLQYAIVNYQRLTFIYSWESVVSEYMLLGARLGFSKKEIEAAFHEKHEINFERLANGY